MAGHRSRQQPHLCGLPREGVAEVVTGKIAGMFLSFICLLRMELFTQLVNPSPKKFGELGLAGPHTLVN